MWILFAIDLAYPTVLYLAFALGYIIPSSTGVFATTTAFLRDLFLLRLGITALCTAHLKFITHKTRPSDSGDDDATALSSKGMWLRVVTITVGICACGVFTLVGLQLFVLDTAFGSDETFGMGSGTGDMGSGGVEAAMLRDWTTRLQYMLSASWQWRG